MLWYKNIYFDFDKSNIRVEAALDLEKILDVMNQYPK
jgi:outer membrane protein OmpA-like peptidoglycan-associated protein